MKHRKTLADSVDELNSALESLWLEVVQALRLQQIVDWINERLTR